MIKLLTKDYIIPSYDPIVRGVSLINNLIKSKTIEASDEQLEGKRLLFKRNVTEACALTMAFGTFLLGLYCNPFHALLDISYYTCLFLCVLTGHLIGTVIGLGTANYTNHLITPNNSSRA